nr:PEP/pyruvate-binding domain-containing protein [Clostridia bacterium]
MTSHDSIPTSDEALRWQLEDMGRAVAQLPLIPDFQKLLGRTDFPETAQSILKTLEKVYDHPVDIEFTANFLPDGSYSFNLLQCRPLQTRSVGPAISLPEPRQEDVLFAFTGNFMGGNAQLRLDYALFVRADAYLALPSQDQYAVARLIGTLNQALKGKTVLLMGPGRWGTSTASLGVPVHFSEISHMTAVCEYAFAGVTPDLSFGSHFFQDLVESNLFYAAIFGERAGVIFRPEKILSLENELARITGSDALAQVVHLARTPSLTLYADVVSQHIVCCGGE